MYPNINPGKTGNCTTCYSITAPAANRSATHWDFLVTESPACSGCITHSFSFIYHVGNSFSDVSPSHLFYSYIEKILHSRITSGCTMSKFCPSDAFQRKHLAKFICNSLNASSPASCQTSTCNNIFTDVPPGNPFCGYIEELYNWGVISACHSNPLRYCPDATTQRQAIAKIICDAMNLINPETCVITACAGLFSDVDATNSYCSYIEAIYKAHIAAGCGTSLYCPADIVLRDQMAKFLVNAFSFAL